MQCMVQKLVLMPLKNLVIENGFFKALPLIGQRFKDCRLAYDYLQASLTQPHTVDIHCDVPCDIGVGDCGGDTSSGGGLCQCLSFCDWPFGSRDFSKRTKRLLLLGLLVVVLLSSYVFYGRQIAEIYITDLGHDQQSLVTRLVQRDQPDVRLLVLVNGKKHYSNIVKLNAVDVRTKFVLKKPITDFNFDRLQILDARLNVANELLVLGQVLETFDSSQMQGQGERFRYRLKRRWHF